MRITRRLEFDAGHRIPNHQSQCRHLHGHRYALEITLGGGVIDASERPDDGMVMDFSEVKAIAKRHVVDLWDHAFLVWCKDLPVVGFLASLPEHKTVVLDRVPTARTSPAWPLPYSTRSTVILTATIFSWNACGFTKRRTAGPTPSAPDTAPHPARYGSTKRNQHSILK
jgi:queuosine biosynthesis protein QueD